MESRASATSVTLASRGIFSPFQTVRVAAAVVAFVVVLHDRQYV
jgi:hypothetical protein